MDEWTPAADGMDEWTPAEIPGLVAWWAGAVRAGDALFAVMVDERTVGDEPVERVIAWGRLD